MFVGSLPFSLLLKEVQEEGGFHDGNASHSANPLTVKF